MQVDFYHLDRAPIEHVLPRIAARVIEAGGRLLIVSANEALSATLDAALWSHAADSFLPHRRADGIADARQPILIAASPEPINHARNVALADGVWRDEALGFERAFFLFDGDTIGAARAAWKALKGRDGVEPRYWKQDDAGKWVQGP